MRNCLRVPRLFVPKDGHTWTVCAPDRGDRAYFERRARKIGDAPSALPLLLPDAYLGDEEESAEELREYGFRMLEEGGLQRYERGSMLVERQTERGVRRGILMCFDLEEYSPDGDKSRAVRALEETDQRLVASRLRARESAPLEFPHAVVCYRDKRDKIMRELEEEELERVYAFELPGGGHIEGLFLPDYIAEDVTHELVSRADPCFGVLEGAHALAAAKLHWENVKKNISAREAHRHPARFALCEFVNLSDDAVELTGGRYVVSETDGEALFDFLSKNVRCKRRGNALFPEGAWCEKRAEELVRRFLRTEGGRLVYRAGEALSEDEYAVAFPAPEKDELLSALKAGKRYPPKTFYLGGEDGCRYLLEGREIGYD